MKIEFKQKFVEKYAKLTDFDRYRDAVMRYPRKSIRVNTLKATVAQVRKELEEHGWKLEPIPWCKIGFYVENTERRDIGNLRGHQEGKFFVQSSVSMIPVIALDPRPGEKVLDLCAAPGSKTTQIAAMMRNKGILVANEMDAGRIKKLLINLKRCGVTIARVTRYAGERFPKDVAGLYDRILVDAPCSGSGLIKGVIAKSVETIKMWNPNRINGLGRLQRKLLENAFSLLKEGGVLVYSTCSLEPEEDEQVVEWFLANVGGRLERIDFPRENNGVLKIWPQDYDTEGFFIARIRK